MALTVAEVIGLPVVQRGKPEVLSAGNWNTQIRWMHGSDLADLSTLLQGGELVLTTGGALARSPRRYLRGLADVGALGVIVELGTATGTLPKSAALIAGELGLALIVLHATVRFVDVTEAVHRTIVADQYEAVAFDRLVHETFTELSMKRASVAGIVDAAARMLSEPVALEDLSRQVLAVSSGAGAAVLQDWERRSRKADEQWAVTPVGPRAEVWGRLVVPRPPAHEGRTKMVLERAAAALALHRMVERDRSGLQHQAQSGLIDDVLRGRITDERNAAARAHALGLKAGAPYLPVVVRVDRHVAIRDPVAAHRQNLELLDAVAHTANASGHSGLFSIRGDGEVGAVLKLRDPRAATRKTLTALGEELRHTTDRLDGGGGSVFAVGAATERVTDAIHGLAEAAHIAEAAQSMRDDTRPFYRASDVRLRGLIALLRDDRRVQRFAETELKALLAGDRPGDLSNVTVLREYLRLAGNKAAVAQRLHMSRPALYKRLTAIREILGVDLDDGESMTSLHVALLIVDAQKRADPGRAAITD